jgi:urea transport system permease protein
MLLKNGYSSTLILLNFMAAGSFGYNSNNTLQHLMSSNPATREIAYQQIKVSADPIWIPLLDALETGLVGIVDEVPVRFGKPLIQSGNRSYPMLEPLSGAPMVGPDGEPLFANRLTRIIYLPRKERHQIGDLRDHLELFVNEFAKRRAAIRRAGNRGDLSIVPTLKIILSQSEHALIQYESQVAIAHLLLQHGTLDDKRLALEDILDLAPSNLLEPLQGYREPSSEQHFKELTVEIDQAIAAIENRKTRLNLYHHTFAGLSLGSILVLMGLGLMIIFGQMGVINMAHGEFMAVGAFSTFVVCQLFNRFLPESLYDWYLILAIPFSFLIAWIVGRFFEHAIIRHLYASPLNSLLATWGISLILIQTLRVIFGDNNAIASPSWLIGGWEVTPGLVLPYNRMFIIVFSTVCVLGVYFMMHKSQFGLRLRATTQLRQTAEAHGIDTRKIDNLAFGFGSGLAGMAGFAVVLFDKINPEMGQSYIVDSFLVVVVGGVGRLEGVLAAGFGLGFFTKYLEPIFQAVYGKVIVLLLVVAFLRWRPEGLFAEKGRIKDV